MLLALATAFVAPSIARADPPPVEDYGKLPGLDMIRLSPSGQRYAFILDDGKARRLYVATTDNNPLQILNIGDKKVTDIHWAGDDFVLIQTSATVNIGPDYMVGKEELAAVSVLNLRTHNFIQVFSKADNIDHTVLGSYGTAQINGRWYGYFGGYSLEADHNGDWLHSNVQHESNVDVLVRDLYRVDLETGAASQVARGEGSGQSWLVGPNGEIIARSNYFQQTGDWRVRSGGFGGRELASGNDKFGGVDLVGLSRTADAILVSHENENNNGTITEELPLAGGPAKVVMDENSFDSPISDPFTFLWIGSETDGDEPSSTFFSPLMQARWAGTRKAFPGHRVHLTSWSQDFNRMIVFTDGGDDSGTYWIVDIDKHSANVLGQAYPTVTEKDVGPVRMIDYKAADGLDLRGVLTLPPGRTPKNLPLVVMPHGGPWARDYPGFDYWAQAFASRGYAVFQPNFRSSTGYGQKLYEAGYGEVGRKMQTDISDGVSELTREGIVDPKRACIVGWSYGGYAAQAGVTIQHGLYRCAVSMAGVSDMAKMLKYVDDEEGGPESAGARIWRLFLGVKSDWGVLRDISPAALAARADAPILLIHGNDDTVVPIAQSDAMEKALQAAGKPVERVTLPGADHWLLREETRVAMIKASVAFVQKYNPADPAPQVVASAATTGP
jgi:dipeptidyl aminopeptidase/acylaminoacyl peptidase